MVQFQLDADTFCKLQPFEYHRRFFEQKTRPDGREFNECRKTKVQTGVLSNTVGSSQIKLGNTLVTCGIKAEVSEPTFENPESGYIVPNIDIPSICAPHFPAGPPHELTQYLSNYLNKITSESKMFNLKDLCITEKKACWVLYVDILCLNYDGNIFDAVLLAMIAAMKTMVLPKANFNELDGTVKTDLNTICEFHGMRLPLSVTFVQCDDKYILIDPTAAEEDVSGTKIIISVNEENELVGILKEGGHSVLSKKQIESCIALAKERCEALRKIILEQSQNQ